MDFDEFLAWDHPGPLRYELVDGAPRTIPLAPVSRGLMHARLSAAIGNHLDAHDRACLVLSNAGLAPGPTPRENFRVADLAVTRAPLRPEAFTVPEPLLLAEILAPDDAARTWANVWTYTTIPSVREILVLRSDRMAADLLRRSADGTWPDRTTKVEGDALELASIGLSLSMAALYEGLGLGG